MTGCASVSGTEGIPERGTCSVKTPPSQETGDRSVTLPVVCTQPVTANYGSSLGLQNKEKILFRKPEFPFAANTTGPFRRPHWGHRSTRETRNTQCWWVPSWTEHPTSPCLGLSVAGAPPWAATWWHSPPVVAVPQGQLFQTCLGFSMCRLQAAGKWVPDAPCCTETEAKMRVCFSAERVSIFSLVIPSAHSERCPTAPWWD